MYKGDLHGHVKKNNNNRDIHKHKNEYNEKHTTQ